MDDGDRLPTAAEVSCFIESLKGWIQHMETLRPIIDSLHPEGTPSRTAWEASYAMLPRARGLVERIERHPTAPIIGSDAAELREISAAIGNAAAVGAEFNPTIPDQIANTLRPAIYARFPEESLERVMADAAFDAVLRAVNDGQNVADEYTKLVVLLARLYAK